MLVLSRKESERIRVGDSIVVTVVRLTKDRVRLGIEAPDDVLVLRDELEKEEPVIAPAVQAKSFANPAPRMAPLARKMSRYSNPQESANYSVALEDPRLEARVAIPKRKAERKMSHFSNPQEYSNYSVDFEDLQEEIGEPVVRRCPERKFFR